jgi:spore coat polysaccharide biosynthesis protein SpsF (cytidylyltransferase family)/sialic acid synthase SpsE
MVYNLIEVANVHAGSIDYLKSLIKEFEHLKGYGMKFQPFKADEIAMPDFEWYQTYKELFFSQEQWKEIINLARKTKDVWIDVFDAYSVQIIKENIASIHGIKFQASTLNNYPLFDALAKTNLSEVTVILNVAALEREQVADIISRVRQSLSPKELVLQVGFQSYPTELSDSGLSKIKTLREEFGMRISYADHVDGKSEEALYAPIIAATLGAEILEKHVMHSGAEPKYDGFSSMPIERYMQYINLLEKYESAVSQPFMNEREKNYLKKSLQVPLTARMMRKGEIPSLQKDFEFKRTAQQGLNVYEIKEQQRAFRVLSHDVPAHSTLSLSDFKNAKIATIIACRMNSKRLPKKATQKIGRVSAIELCIKNCLGFKNVEHTILATSETEEDDELRNYTYDSSVIFHKGDPDDVIKRYLGIIDKLGIDVVIRVTGDMQFVCDDILQLLLKSHFETGADYTTPAKAAIGTNLQIMNASAMRKVKEHFPSALYSEYMTFYFENNPEHFKINRPELPAELVRDYRLTLDYAEDLQLFREIQKHFDESGREFSTTAMYDFLDANPEIAKINSTCTLSYRTDPKLIETLNKHTKING